MAAASLLVACRKCGFRFSQGDHLQRCANMHAIAMQQCMPVAESFCAAEASHKEGETLRTVLFSGVCVIRNDGLWRRKAVVRLPDALAVADGHAWIHMPNRASCGRAFRAGLLMLKAVRILRAVHNSVFQPGNSDAAKCRQVSTLTSATAHPSFLAKSRW